MKVRLTMTLHGVKGEVDLNALRTMLKNQMIETHTSHWQECGMEENPDNYTFKVLSCEDESEE